MKKVLSTAMMLALALSLLCPALMVFAEATNVEGTWYLNSLIFDGIEMSPAAVGLETSITLNADGTALMQSVGEDDGVAAWSQDGETITVTSEDEVIVFTLDGDTLVMGDEEGTMIFGQEKTEAEPFVASPVREDVALSDFDGTWTATIIDMMGMQLPVGSFGMDMTLTIRNGSASISSIGEEGEQANTANGVFEGNTLTLDVPASETSMGTTMALVLREDGSMSYTDDRGEAMTIYFEKR